MGEIRPPGIYREKEEEKRYTPITLAKSGIAGFVGLAEKGPTNTPVKITSFEEFKEIFGNLNVGSYLGPAVQGFFLNGGKECYVLRIAHLTEKGRGEIAKPATLRLLDKNGKPTILISATSEGIWGNEIKISVESRPPSTQTFLTLDLHEGDTEATIKSTHGFQRGTIIRLFENGNFEYRVIYNLSGKVISFLEPLSRKFSSGTPTLVEPVEWSLRVTTPKREEIFNNLSFSVVSANYFEKVINTKSRLIRVANLNSPNPIPENFPVEVTNVPLKGGSDGLYNVTPDDFIGFNVGPNERTGISAYEVVEDVDILIAPDLMWCLKNSTNFSTQKDVEVVQQAMISQCENLKDRFAILDLPDEKSHRLASQWRLMFDSQYAAFYFPWLLIESRGNRISIPPSGHVAGIYARCDNNFGVHKPPANEEILGIYDLTADIRDEEIGFLNSEGINCIRAFTTRGIRIWGARTTSSDTQLRYINVRRVINTIIRSLNLNSQWVVFEPNSPKLWKTLSRNVTSFLYDLWKKGFFKGRYPEDAFYVKCDDETNPPEVRDAGQLVVEVGVAPVRPAEFIIFKVSQQIIEAEKE